MHWPLFCREEVKMQMEGRFSKSGKWNSRLAGPGTVFSIKGHYMGEKHHVMKYNLTECLNLRDPTPTALVAGL